MTSPTSDRRQGLVGNTPIKAPVDCATTANIVISGEQVIDGVQTAKSRVLVMNQTDSTQNGIYDSNSAGWTRSADADGNFDLTKGTMVLVAGGTVNTANLFQVSSSNPITIGTSAITFFKSVFSQAAYLSFIAAGFGAQARAAQDKMRERISFLDWQPKNDGATNDGAANRAAVASFPSTGGKLYMGAGTTVSDASGGSALVFSAPISVEGVGGVYGSAFNPSLAAVTDKTWTVTPNAGFDYTLMKFNSVTLHNPNDGTRVGTHGMLLNTQAVGLLPKFTVRDSIIGQGSSATGWGIYALNVTASNPTGGTFCALFDNLAVKGGIRLEGTGDSNSIVHCNLLGTRIGVWGSNTPGASCLEIQANNITTAQGAIHIEAGPRFRIVGNNMEHSAVGAVANNDSSMVDIIGSSGTMYSGVIQANLISAFGSSDATILARVANCRGTLVQDNTFLNGASAAIGIQVDASSQDVRIGPNSFDAAVTTQVNDNGVGTMGVRKDATLLNSWVAFAAATYAFSYIKSPGDGLVHVTGAIKSGTTTNGTIVATLPVGFRPGQIVRVPIMYVNAGVPGLAEMSVDTSGNCTINYVASATQVEFNFTFPAANLAHSVSLE
jgi:hypothetical protein